MDQGPRIADKCTLPVHVFRSTVSKLCWPLLKGIRANEIRIDEACQLLMDAGLFHFSQITRVLISKHASGFVSEDSSAICQKFWGTCSWFRENQRTFGKFHELLGNSTNFSWTSGKCHESLRRSKNLLNVPNTIYWDVPRTYGNFHEFAGNCTNVWKVP